MTFYLPGLNINALPTQTGISQALQLSNILVLFLMLTFFDAGNHLILRIFSTTVATNVNALAITKLIRENSRMLQVIYQYYSRIIDFFVYIFLLFKEALSCLIPSSICFNCFRFSLGMLLEMGKDA